VFHFSVDANTASMKDLKKNAFKDLRVKVGFVQAGVLVGWWWVLDQGESLGQGGGLAGCRWLWTQGEGVLRPRWDFGWMWVGFGSG
jgi:hypothetical protein